MEIAREDLELFARRLGGHDLSRKVRVAPPNPLDRASPFEAAGVDPHRFAGLAAFAGRAIGKTVRAAKAGVGKRIVDLFRVGSPHLGEQLAFEFAGQVGAGHLGQREEGLGAALKRALWLAPFIQRYGPARHVTLRPLLRALLLFVLGADVAEEVLAQIGADLAQHHLDPVDKLMQTV